MSEHKQNLLLGAVICAVGYIFISAMGACAKLVGKQVSVTTILFFQSAICLLLIIPQTVKAGSRGLKTKKIGLHLVRDVAGLLSFFSLFFALRSIPLVDGILLQNTAPLWIPLVIFVWSRIRMRGHLWWGMIVGFVGVILILKPGAGVLDTGSFFGIASGIFLAISLVAIRKLTTTEPTYRILFFYFLLGVVVTAPFFLTDLTIPSGRDLMLLLGVGVFMFLAQILITYAFTHGKASTFAPIAYSAVVYSGILGWLIWGHVPDLISCLGLLLVIIGGILSIFFEKRYEKKISSS